MTTVTSLIENISTMLIIVACSACLSSRLPRKRQRILVLSVLMLSLIPVAGSSLWFWINGAVGQLSVLTMILLTVFVWRRFSGWSLLEAGSRRQLYYLILIAGFLLYPASLGLSIYDPYVLGFGSTLSMALLSLAVFYWLLKARQVAVVLLIVMATESIGLLNSSNTWDYLIDPLVWIASPILLIIMEIIRRRKVTE